MITPADLYCVSVTALQPAGSQLNGKHCCQLDDSFVSYFVGDVRYTTANPWNKDPHGIAVFPLFYIAYLHATKPLIAIYELCWPFE